MQLVNIVVNGFVHRFHTARDIDLPVELGGLIVADVFFQLLDQLTGFTGRDEFCGLDGINQQLQLWQLKIPRAKMILCSAVPLLRYDVKTIIPQLLKMIVERLSIGGNIHSGQFPYDLLQRKRMLVVGLRCEDVHEMEYFHFAFCHRRTPPRSSL